MERLTNKEELTSDYRKGKSIPKLGQEIGEGVPWKTLSMAEKTGSQPSYYIDDIN